MRTLSKAKNQGMMRVPLSSGMLTWFSAFIPINGEFVIGVERRIYRNRVSNFGDSEKRQNYPPHVPRQHQSMQLSIRRRFCCCSTSIQVRIRTCFLFI